jgi:hypothetical protein
MYRNSKCRYEDSRNGDFYLNETLSFVCPIVLSGRDSIGLYLSFFILYLIKEHVIAELGVMAYTCDCRLNWFYDGLQCRIYIYSNKMNI